MRDAFTTLVTDSRPSPHCVPSVDWALAAAGAVMRAETEGGGEASATLISRVATDCGALQADKPRAANKTTKKGQ